MRWKGILTSGPDSEADGDGEVEMGIKRLMLLKDVDAKEMIQTYSLFIHWVVKLQIFLIFTLTWGNDPIWRAYFSNGLKPPTSSEIHPVIPYIDSMD